MQLVYIRTLPRQISGSGIHEWADPTTGEKLNATKISADCKTKYPALFNAKTRRLMTGLNEKVTNEWYQKEGENKDLPQEFRHLSNESEILLQHALEIKHGVPFNHYTDVPGVGKNKTFFDKFRIVLDDGVTVLDMSNPRDELSYYVARDSKYIANSPAEQRQHKWPKATHVLYEEGESENESYDKRFVIDQAKANLINMNDDNRVKIAKILDIARGHVQGKKAYTELSKYIEKSQAERDPKSAKEFNSFASKLESAEGRSEIDARALLEDLTFFGVVKESQDIFTWWKGNKKLGDRKEQAVKYLLNPAKQPEIDEMTEELEANMKFK